MKLARARVARPRESRSPEVGASNNPPGRLLRENKISTGKFNFGGCEKNPRLLPKESGPKLHVRWEAIEAVHKGKARAVQHFNEARFGGIEGHVVETLVVSLTFLKQ